MRKIFLAVALVATMGLGSCTKKAVATQEPQTTDSITADTTKVAVDTVKVDSTKVDTITVK